MNSSCVFLIGNPGAGKSEICNSLGASFKSGISIGEGMPTDLQFYETDINGDKYKIIDAPGLYDYNMIKTKQNASAIQDGLSQGVKYKIIFVLTLQSGRLIAQDLSMMKAVVNSIDVQKDQIAIIFNKVDEDTMDELKNGGTGTISSIFAQENILYRPNCITSIKLHAKKNRSDMKQDMEKAVILMITELISRPIKVTSDIRLTHEEVRKMEENIAKMSQTVNNLKESYEHRIKELEESLESSSNIKKEDYEKQIKVLIDERDKRIKVIETRKRVAWGIGTLGTSEVVRFFTKDTT